jgi:prophage tail gpP-like protein
MSSLDTKRTRVIIQAAPPGTTAGSDDFKELLWKKVKIRKSLDEICHYMELIIPVSERAKINKHDIVEVRYFNPLITDSSSRRRVTTILVDEITDATDAYSKNLSIIGRSPARDIIDSTWSGMILNRQNLEYIANEIAKKFDIKVGRMPTNSPETGPVFSFSWENESPWTKLISEADNQGYIFTSNEAGNLYLWKVASGLREEGFFLLEGQNIRDIQTTQNGAEQFHEYVVRGAGKEARQIDATCKNKRILTINLTDFMINEEPLIRRAKTEMLRRRENRTLVTVTGWGLNDQQIKALGNTEEKEVFWNPNFLTSVKIPSSGLDDNLLISQVEYEADQSAMSCSLTLVNKDAYS